MAVWEVRLVYQTGDRFWENVWHVDVGSADDVPSALVLAFETFGLSTLRDIYTLARIARRPAGSTNEFIDVIVGAAGSVVTGADKVLPLFNVVRLLLEAGAGRPGVKLLRGLLVGGDLADEQNHLAAPMISLVQSAANDLFNAASDASCTFVVGAGNRPAVSPSVDPQVEMRQRHRKRKKTT